MVEVYEIIGIRVLFLERVKTDFLDNHFIIFFYPKITLMNVAFFGDYYYPASGFWVIGKPKKPNS
jgi:hypothetical protein